VFGFIGIGVAVLLMVTAKDPTFVVSSKKSQLEGNSEQPLLKAGDVEESVGQVCVHLQVAGACGTTPLRWYHHALQQPSPHVLHRLPLASPTNPSPAGIAAACCCNSPICLPARLLQGNFLVLGHVSQPHPALCGGRCPKCWRGTCTMFLCVWLS
jgi:hypothetical protein